MRIVSACLLVMTLDCTIAELSQSAFPLQSAVACADDMPPPKKRPPDDFSLDLPRPETLFQVRSEATIRDEIRADAKLRGIKKTEFPQDANPVATVADLAQLYTPRTMAAPSGVVCFRTLYFQDISRERDLKSWRVGEPLREVLGFFGVAASLPVLGLAAPPWRYQCWHYPFHP